MLNLAKMTPIIITMTITVIATDSVNNKTKVIAYKKK